MIRTPQGPSPSISSRLTFPKNPPFPFPAPLSFQEWHSFLRPWYRFFFSGQERDPPIRPSFPFPIFFPIESQTVTSPAALLTTFFRVMIGYNTLPPGSLFSERNVAFDACRPGLYNEFPPDFFYIGPPRRVSFLVLISPVPGFLILPLGLSCLCKSTPRQWFAPTCPSALFPCSTPPVDGFLSFNLFDSRNCCTPVHNPHFPIFSPINTKVLSLY